MAGEKRAHRILGNELGLAVVINDDNSKPEMYDLRIGESGAPEVAIECVGSVDSIFTETWNVGPATGPISAAILGDWNVTIASGARVKIVRNCIESLLHDLESRGIYTVRTDHWLKRCDETLFLKLNSLGIEDASCYRVEGNGQIHLGMPAIGGAVDGSGSAIPDWISDFIHAPTCSDVLNKLQRSNAKHRHVFVIVAFGGAPWAVESYLIGKLDILPLRGPNLPPAVDEVWIVSDSGRSGLRWDGELWRRFDAC